MAEVGSRLGGLTLERELGAGGFGKVFLGRPDVGPPRAVKILRDASIAGSLRREAETLLALRHPRIVELVHADLSNEPAYLVMELVEGGPLDARLPLAAAEARDVCRGLLEGLAHAHGKGIAHLDLKPTNVLMAADGPKLADFGLARAALADGSLKRSGSATSISGTLAYMAPEVSGGETGDARADMYSLGVMLCQMLTGKLPQPGDTLDELLGTTPPAWAQALFSRCYCRREKRLANASEALKLLDEGQNEAIATSASGRVSVLQPEEGTRACPFCREKVLVGALKCKHCNERLDQAAPLASRPGGFKCAVHHEQDAAANCARCGNPFCSPCLTELKGRNHCRVCIAAVVEEQEREAAKAAEQIEREKDRASSKGPNIVVTATGGSASSSATAVAGGGGGGGGRLPVRLADPLKAALLTLLWPGLGHAYNSRRVRGLLLALAGAVCAVLMLSCSKAATDTHNDLVLWLPALVLLQPWLLGAFLAYRGANEDNAARREYAAGVGATTFPDPLFRWTWMSPVGVDEEGGAGFVRPMNLCGSCGYTWYPRGHAWSPKCPRCSSTVVQSGGRSGLSIRALGIAGLVGFCLLYSTVTSIAARITVWELERQAASRVTEARRTGLAAYEAGDWTTAYTNLEVALRDGLRDDGIGQKIAEARSRHVEQLVGHAAQLEQAGKLLESLEQLDLAGQVNATEKVLSARKRVSYQLGQQAFAAGDYEQARIRFTAAQDHTDAPSMLARSVREINYARLQERVTLAERAVAEGRVEAALDEFGKLPKTFPETPDGRSPLSARVQAVATAIYERALAAESSAELARAMALFRGLGEFRDAQAKASDIQQRLDLARAEEERRKEDERRRVAEEVEAKRLAADQERERRVEEEQRRAEAERLAAEAAAAEQEAQLSALLRGADLVLTSGSVTYLVELDEAGRATTFQEQGAASGSRYWAIKEWRRSGAGVTLEVWNHATSEPSKYTFRVDLDVRTGTAVGTMGVARGRAARELGLKDTYNEPISGNVTRR